MNYIFKQVTAITMVIICSFFALSNNVACNQKKSNNQKTTIVTSVHKNNKTNKVNNNSKKQKQKKKKNKKVKLKAYSVPKEASSFKTYMDYTCITVKSSPQYKLQKKAYTSKNGLRKVGKYYCIALGSYYGSKIGTKYKITLSTGKSFWGILADQKSDSHTDSKHQYTVFNKDIIEFVVQTSKLPNKVKISGDISSINRFKGKITKIEKVI